MFGISNVDDTVQILFLNTDKTMLEIMISKISKFFASLNANQKIN